VADRDRLGLAGRSRGVDGVAQVVRIQADRGGRRRLALEHGGQLAEREHPDPPGEGFLGRTVRQDRDGAGFRAYPGQAGRRQRRVQRQVPAARLHDREQAADRVGTAFSVDADQGLRAGAQVQEAAGEPVGRGVKLAVGHLRARGDDRDRAGPAGGLLGEPLMDEPDPVPDRNASRSDVRPNARDGVQAGAPGHDGRLPSPAARRVTGGPPERILARVVDDDGKGVPRRIPRIVHVAHGCATPFVRIVRGEKFDLSH